MTSVVHDSSVKTSHIALGFCRFHIAMQHLVAMWILKFNLSSAHAPRYLIHALCLTASQFTLISVDTHLDICCLKSTKQSFILWSSAKPWRSIEVDTTSSNIDAYALYKMGPATLPWGTEDDNDFSIEYRFFHHHFAQSWEEVVLRTTLMLPLQYWIV